MSVLEQDCTPEATRNVTCLSVTEGGGGRSDIVGGNCTLGGAGAFLCVSDENTPFLGRFHSHPPLLSHGGGHRPVSSFENGDSTTSSAPGKVAYRFGDTIKVYYDGVDDGPLQMPGTVS